MKRYQRELTIEELAAMPDEDIDYSDIPEADDQFWKSARVHVPDTPKMPLSVNAQIAKWRSNPEFAAAYDALEEEFALAAQRINPVDQAILQQDKK